MKNLEPLGTVIGHCWDDYREYCETEGKQIRGYVPKCLKCGAPMENAVDNILDMVSPYLWKTTCEHNKNIIVGMG